MTKDQAKPDVSGKSDAREFAERFIEKHRRLFDKLAQDGAGR
ncbi:hypothetical protein [Halegenticoccus soli]|nr:hypothetical protein [Halegenticoccus soli]